MTSEEKLEELWREMVKLDAEYELAKRGLDLAVAEHGLSSSEAVEASQRLSSLGLRLLRIDGEYTARLKWAGWIWDE